MMAFPVSESWPTVPENGSKYSSGAVSLPHPEKGHTAAHTGEQAVLFYDCRWIYRWPEEADVRVYSVRPLPLAPRPRRAAQLLLPNS